MYFDQIPLFNFKEHFNTATPFHAHLSKDVHGNIKFELLEEHMNLTMSYFDKLCVEKNLNPIFHHFEDQLVGILSDPARALWKELLYNTIYTHDLGKTNPNFQYQKMNNHTHQATLSKNTNHSYFSALIYANHYLNKVLSFKGKEQHLLFFSLVFNSYIISKHHGYLSSFPKFLEEISRDLGKEKPHDCVLYLESFGSVINKSGIIEQSYYKVLTELKRNELWQSIPWIIYGRFLFGLLVSCDFYATSDFMNGPVQNFGTIKDINNYRMAFNQSLITQNIRKYQQSRNSATGSPFEKDDINTLRSELFLEAEKNLLKNPNESLFFFEAPTGSGKTNTSINLALKLLESDSRLNKITYVFPFNTLVEQTKSSLISAFNAVPSIADDITVVNGITSIKSLTTSGEDYPDGELYTSEKKRSTDAEKCCTDYEQSLLARQFLHYPMVLTTHVNFFNTLFGTDRESVFPLAHLANSVIILDEIQSYPNHLWKEIILFLQDYAQLLNMRIIIMSATLPDLGQLSLKDALPVPRLIKDPQRYYQHPLFKDRVSLDFSLLKYNRETILDKLLDKIIETSIALENNPDFVGFENKILVEFIKKSTALDFFTRLNEKLISQGINRDVLCMTGDDNKAERKRIIEKVRTGKNLILVATQVIEAGVDIDMDMGFKDISLFDAEEQFLGRINRSCKKKGAKVFFFNYDPADLLYRNDFRKQEYLTIQDQTMWSLLESKNFTAFYDIILEEINASKQAYNESNIENFARETLWNLDYFALQKHMQLIDDERQEISLFICGDPFEIDGILIDSSTLWDDYVDLLKNNSMGYAEKRVRLSNFSEKMDYFIYQIPMPKYSFDYQGQIGDLYRCERDETFFPNGKFDRNAFRAYYENNLFL
ncbi:CRISPR-associated helicase Cas3' [Acetobacterium sp. UBA5834]|jgi:CRISPR-associated endonuclease/helicase Cas3|uniref:CRISPR-associated helicase Cas3' n=1 Tax=Acetobacterium sp. UBA5834 TaxID=1945907 RepID=UPI00257B6807|nr:CRISPR-associated helicase Cas3' [Acetobacterium sp. UBA5834]